MRNIVYISYSSTPSHNPSSLQIVKTCEAFSSLGYKVDLLIPNTGIGSDINNYYDIKNKFNIKIFKYIKKFPRGYFFYLYSFSCLIFSIFKKNTIFISRNFFLSFLLCIFYKKNILEIHHDINIEGRLSKFIIKHSNFLNNSNLIRIVSISESLKKLYSNKYNVKKKKITVLPSGSSIEMRPSFKYKPKKKFKIGYFGSLSKSKGLETVINLSKIDNDNEYYIFGGNKDFVKKLKIKVRNNNLNISSHINYGKIFKYISDMDLLIIPYTKKVHSSGDVDNIAEYTSPLKLFDYLACGKLIIASDLKVLREVLKKPNCFFVKNFENIYNWKLEIKRIKNLKEKKIIYDRNNFFYSKIFNHKNRVKKYLVNL